KTAAAIQRRLLADRHRGHAARAQLFLGQQHSRTTTSHVGDSCPQLSGRAKLDAECCQRHRSSRGPWAESRSPHKKTGLVGPVSSGVELRIGHLTTWRERVGKLTETGGTSPTYCK